MRGLNADDGNVVIIVALMMVTLLGAAALSIDAGMMYVRHSQVQTGADAAALAIATDCVQRLVADDDPCNSDTADDVAGDYLDRNVAGLDAPSIESLDFTSELEGRAGHIAVTGSTDEPAVFARMFDVERQRTAATATARWGPIIAAEVFPLAVCRGALPDPGDDGLIVSDTRTGADPPTPPCDGDVSAQPLGWLSALDADTCSAEARTSPPTEVDIDASNDEPTDSQCEQELNELKDAVANGASAADRTRVLAVYDAGSNPGGPYSTYSLVAFEFTGIRWKAEVQSMAGSPDMPAPCDKVDDTFDEVQCIRGAVNEWLPPGGGTLADLDDLLVPGVADTTVLDVRLVD